MSVWQVSQNVSWCIIELGSDRVGSTNSEADTHWKGRGLCRRNKPSRVTMKSTWSWLDIVDLNATIATLSSLQPCQSKKRMGVDFSLLFLFKKKKKKNHPSNKKKKEKYIIHSSIIHFMTLSKGTVALNQFSKNNMHTSAPTLTFFHGHEWINCPLMANQWKRHFHLGFIDNNKKRGEKSTLSTWFCEPSLN